MIRFRKYRVFLAIAFVVIIAIWNFNHVQRWQPSSLLTSRPTKQETQSIPLNPESTVATDIKVDENREKDLPAVARESIVPSAHLPVADGGSKPARESLPPLPVKDKPVQEMVARPDIVEQEEIVDNNVLDSSTATLASIADAQGEDTVTEIPQALNAALPSAEAIHWSSMPERFPVTSTIQLPVGSPKPIPKIQHDFAKETEEDHLTRTERLDAVKDEFLHSWKGYKDHAWLNDELTPVTGTAKNPFCGWAATLVDALDTLWIMGLKEEFEHAVEAVGTIDFTTTERREIPLFETTIRYLGGLLAAYDISDGKYTILLDKAVELANILMGAFDTPNRMPSTYYQWKPSEAVNEKRAGKSMVLAELGSLAVEFTRLAQLTLEPKYYDAVARITDALDEWQDNTRVPGMWPTLFDASGCKKSSAQPSSPQNLQSVQDQQATDTIKNLLDEEDDNRGNDNEDSREPESAAENVNEGGNANAENQNSVKEALAEDNSIVAEKSLDKRDVSESSGFVEESASSEEVCEPQGLTSSSLYGTETYTLAGQSDSTYEYLPKQYLLLDGQVDKYRSMYEKSAEVFIDKLFFRPMTEGNLDILISGDYRHFRRVNGQPQVNTELIPQNSHLTCFTGGMVAMAAKIFERKEDLEIAAKITEGCIWSYDATTSGIMPEEFEALPCPDDGDNCQWDEAYWREKLDPNAQTRAQQYEHQMKLAKDREERLAKIKATKEEEEQKRRLEAPGSSQQQQMSEDEWPRQEQPTQEEMQQQKQRHQAEPVPVSADKNEDQVRTKAKRDLPAGKQPIDPKTPIREILKSTLNSDKTDQSSHLYDAYHIKPPTSHDDFVDARIREERLPKGFTRISRRNYILRPEAIESVYYLYRITGDAHWREAGWRMFMNVRAATRTQFGHSAIDDVTKTSPRPQDSMESFWLAETLKYYYLLFSDESVVSLDEWVFNTEAHPLRRPRSS